MAESRDEFLHNQNVLNYTRRLRDAPDDAQRKMLMALLAEEKAKARAQGWMPNLG